jgi:hypothetical protein
MLFLPFKILAGGSVRCVGIFFGRYGKFGRISRLSWMSPLAPHPSLRTSSSYFLKIPVRDWEKKRKSRSKKRCGEGRGCWRRSEGMEEVWNQRGWEEEGESKAAQEKRREEKAHSLSPQPILWRTRSTYATAQTSHRSSRVSSKTSPMFSLFLLLSIQTVTLLKVLSLSLLWKGYERFVCSDRKSKFICERFLRHVSESSCITLYSSCETPTRKCSFPSWTRTRGKKIE